MNRMDEYECVWWISMMDESGGCVGCARSDNLRHTTTAPFNTRKMEMEEQRGRDVAEDQGTTTRLLRQSKAPTLMNLSNQRHVLQKRL